MVTIIRDRVRDLIKAGRSLDRGKGCPAGEGIRGALRQRRAAHWTTDRFVEAIYRSLAKEKP